MKLDELTIGYVFVPIGLDRTGYMHQCFLKNTVAVMKDYGGFPIFDVPIPPYLLPEIYFPDIEKNEFLGSAVVLANIAKHNSPVIIAILYKGNEIPVMNENTKGISLDLDTVSSNILLDDKSCIFVTASNLAEAGDSVISLRSTGTGEDSQIRLETDTVFAKQKNMWLVSGKSVVCSILDTSGFDEPKAPTTSFSMIEDGATSMFSQKSIEFRTLLIDPEKELDAEDREVESNSIKLDEATMSTLVKSTAKIDVQTVKEEKINTNIVMDHEAGTVTTTAGKDGEIKASTVMSGEAKITMFAKEMPAASIELDGEGGKVTILAKEGIDYGSSGTEPAVLGETLKGLLEELCDAIGKITVPTAFGPSGVPTNASDFSSLKSKFKDILSDLVKVGMK